MTIDRWFLVTLEILSVFGAICIVACLARLHAWLGMKETRETIETTASMEFAQRLQAETTVRCVEQLSKAAGLRGLEKLEQAQRIHATRGLGELDDVFIEAAVLELP